MNKKSIKIYAIWILSTLAVGGISALLSRSGMQLYNESIEQPALSPPAILFPIVWSILYTLMGFSVAKIYLSKHSSDQSKGINLYISQLIVNFFWSLIFFNAQAFGFAFIWLLLLWGLVLWMILTFRKIDSIAAYLQIPYLLWLTFAAYLNAGVWYLN